MSMDKYFDSLKEQPNSVLEIIALWKNRMGMNLPGCPCRWGYHQLEDCIKDLENMHERTLYDKQVTHE